ncbi:MAG: alpha/beta fold hydrolase, partial [Flavobacteriales bacterium]|nr:alpha/beta fold hydrolase [Flavobacteriales bacterium]
FSYELMAEDLKKYCAHHNLKNSIILGHSMGGKTAMRFAAKYPQMVDKLIVADIAPKHYPQHHQDILKGLSALNFKEMESREDADVQLENYISHFGVRQFLLKNLYRKTKDEFALRMNLPVLIENIEEVGIALEENLTYAGETLFLKGEKSDYIEDMDEISIKKQFPKAILKTVSKAGHWLHAENPKEFYAYVMEFLDQKLKSGAI